jgi:ABC-type nitrate/sulfonate/bicarbonate transport system substrate-binding protein
MPTPAPTPPAPAPLRGPRALRVGFLPLTDAAPLIVAQHRGLFAQHGLRVELRREIGWATVRDKITYGELDAAHAPAPMLWAMQLGLSTPPCDVLTALVLNRNGNAITLSRALWEAGVRDAGSLREHARSRRARQPLTFGVVFTYSTHHLLLTSWLRTAGLEPDRDVRIVVVPPAQMFRNLAARTIDGFCSGEPWNTHAVRAGAGWCPAWSAALQPGHVEKVIAVKQSFADTHFGEHAALVRAISEAAAWCDELHHREPLAEILSDPRYLDLPAAEIAPALTGRFDCGHGRVEQVPDFLVFHRDAAGVPTEAPAAALQRSLSAAGLLPAAAASDPQLPRRLFREDLHHESLESLHAQRHLHETNTPSDLRGVASQPG